MEKKIEQMRKELDRAIQISEIYDEIVNQMKWNAMERTEEKDENGDAIYKAPDKDSWRYDKYNAYKEVLSVIEKMIK